MNARSAPRISLQLRWSIDAAGEREIDPVLVALLDAIVEGGSLRYAATRLRLSYRHAWGMLREWEGLLGQPLVGLTRGRGAVLTPAGERLRWAWHTAEARVRPQLDSLAAGASSDLAATFAPGTARLRVAASHDFALAVMKDVLAREHRLAVDLHYYGSLASLQRLRLGQCDAAGFHVPQGALGLRLAGDYRRWLDAQGDRLLVVADREQGFIVRRDLAFTGIRDLPGGRLRFVNRQPGAGSRLAFDALAAQAGIEPAAIAGYDSEEYTHLAVAALVASGAADVAFGLRAAALRFDLGFVPVFTERYFLAAPRATLGGVPLLALRKVLAASAFRVAANALGGYDAALAGELQPVAAAFG